MCTTMKTRKGFVIRNSRNTDKHTIKKRLFHSKTSTIFHSLLDYWLPNGVSLNTETETDSRSDVVQELVGVNNKLLTTVMIIINFT